MAVTVALEAVSKRYARGVEAVRDVSLELGAGEIVALVGHNGAGKTTLMKLILGLVRATSGALRVLGEDPVSGAFSVRRAVGFLPESVSFNSALTGRETLAFYARLKGRRRPEVDDLLARVGLDGAADRRIGGYSKGMRQRLGLAQALLGEPRVLLFDEPTTGLDPALRQSFYALLDELRARGATVLLSSHALAELGERASRVILMHRGVKAADGALDELRRLARLPTRVRVKLAGGELAEAARSLAGDCAWRKVECDTLEIGVPAEAKLAVLRRIVERGAEVLDVEAVAPSLDELYAHFLRVQEETLH
jgi:Cu-processing system ATP-binding protein